MTHPPLLSFYGDDFTGASAVMEVLSFAGVPTMLFTKAPTAEMRARYPDMQAIGIAGIARSQSPDWMRNTLPAIFDALKATGAPLLHYKVCSTFDSAPHVGSIGTAIELGAKYSAAGWVPLVVGAPDIGRYQVFGELFAAAGNTVHRLDRHPVMSRHPVTPMNEADLCTHLSKQTSLAMGKVTLDAMKTGRSDTALASCLQNGAQVIAIDALDTETLREAGRLIWQDGKIPVFAAGSQGIEYALVAHWQETGALPVIAETPSLAPVSQIFAVSGSCAPTTAAQIAHAENSGALIIPFDASTAIAPDALEIEVTRVESLCLLELQAGRDVIVCTARGPDDPALTRMNAAIANSDCSAATANDRLGAALGQLTRRIRLKTNLPRVAICGGDTSSHALSALDADALSALAPLAPGAPLCRLHSSTAQIDGLEVTLKGGQMGTPDFFQVLKSGKA